MRQPTTTEKVDFIRRVASTGVPEIEITGFVHPRVIPQLADAEAVAAAVVGQLPGTSLRALGGTSQVDKMQYKYVFRTTPSDSTLTAAMAYFAVQKGWKKAVMLFETTSDATDELNHTTAYFTANGGTILDSELTTPSSSPRWQ